VLYNAGQVRGRLYDQIESTFSNFRKELDERVDAAVVSTHGAAQAALKKRQNHAKGIAADLDRIEALLGSLEDTAAHLENMEVGVDSIRQGPVSSNVL
jgi:hypothetical protein